MDVCAARRGNGVVEVVSVVRCVEDGATGQRDKFSLSDWCVMCVPTGSHDLITHVENGSRKVKLNHASACPEPNVRTSSRQCGPAADYVMRD
jgi:hypothetical protein